MIKKIASVSALLLIIIGFVFIHPTQLKAQGSQIVGISINGTYNDSSQSVPNSSSNPASSQVVLSWSGNLFDSNQTFGTDLCDYSLIIDGSDRGCPGSLMFLSPPGSQTWTIGIDVSATGYGAHTACINAGSNIPSCTSIYYAAPSPATVTVTPGSCPVNAAWTSSTGNSGVGTGGFTFAPSNSGTLVTISSSVSSFQGTSPGPQLAFPGGTYSFALRCGTPPPSSVTLTPDTNSLSCAQTATLTWSSVGATSCSAPWTGSTATSGSQSGIGAGTYNITCSNAGGSTMNVTPVTITTVGGSCAVPSVSVNASPSSISSGGSSLISWTTSNATSCSSDWWSGSTALNGSAWVNPSVSTTYTKTCSNDNGGGSDSKTVTVNTTASVTLLPTSQTIVNGNSATLTWSGTNISSCSGTAPSANWNSSSATSGSKSVSPSSSTTYTISCISSVGGTNPSANATVNVGASLPDLTVGASSPTTALTTTNTNLTASVSNVGGSSTGASFSNFFQVATASNGGGTVSDLTSSAVAALASGASITATYNNYQFASAGTYSIRACADKTSSGNAGVIAESNEGNNCGAWTDVVVSNAGGSFDYSLSNSGSITVTKGGVPQSGQNTVNVSLVSGTPQPVTLSLSGAPAGVSSSASTCTPSNPPCTSTITITVPSSASTGTFPITVTGSPLNHTTNFNLTIVPSSAILVTCIPSPSTALVGNPVTWTGGASGGSGGYTYAWSGPGISTSPAPSTASFNQTYSTVGLKTAQLAVTDSLGNTGTCTPAGSVQINFNPQFKEF